MPIFRTFAKRKEARLPKQEAHDLRVMTLCADGFRAQVLHILRDSVIKAFRFGWASLSAPGLYSRCTGTERWEFWIL